MRDSGDESEGTVGMRCDLENFVGKIFFSTVGTSLNWLKFNMPLPPSSTLHAAHAASIVLRCVTPPDIGLAQPGLPGGAFGASLQGPGKEVKGGPASRRTSPTGIMCVSTA